jgi:hypothetical protein
VFLVKILMIMGFHLHYRRCTSEIQEVWDGGIVRILPYAFTYSTVLEHPQDRQLRLSARITALLVCQDRF